MQPWIVCGRKRTQKIIVDEQGVEIRPILRVGAPRVLYTRNWSIDNAIDGSLFEYLITTLNFHTIFNYRSNDIVQYLSL